MAHLLLGIFSGIVFMAFLNYTVKKGIKLDFLFWLLTLSFFCCFLFVAEIIIAFLQEGAARAALVMGTLLGTLLIVWGILLGRFFSVRRISRGR